MGGDYPSSDFELKEDGGLRLSPHPPPGMTIESKRLPADPIGVSPIIGSSSRVMSARSGEVTQAASTSSRLAHCADTVTGWASLRGGRTSRGGALFIADSPTTPTNRQRPLCRPPAGEEVGRGRRLCPDMTFYVLRVIGRWHRWRLAGGCCGVEPSIPR